MTLNGWLRQAGRAGDQLNHPKLCHLWCSVASLRRMQWEKAEVGDTSMLIWLGKVMCGQKDTSAVVLTGPNNGPVQSQSVSVTVPMNDPIEARFS
jgi:hypothetical protein